MTLHKKVIISVILILVMILSIYSYYMISTMKNQVMQSMENSALVIAQSLERSIVTSGAMDNPKLLQTLVMDFNKVEGIHEVYVVNSNYTIIAHPDTRKIGSIYNNPDVKGAINEGKKETELKRDDGMDLFDVVIPILSEGKIQGAIEVELDFQKVKDLIISATQKAIIAIIITILALAFVLITILFNVVVKPIENLVKATNEIAAGSFKTISMPPGKDEIGQLTKAFNGMIIALEKLSQRDKSSNPLTGLPGNIIIKEELDSRINRNESFSVLYIDLDNFKDFNDTFGFEHGDEAIKYTADVIKRAVKEKGTANDFVGHIGGDDFVAISDINYVEEVAKNVIKLFNMKKGCLYTEIIAEGLTISVAIVNVPIGKIKNSLAIGEIAAKLKKKVKCLPGSNYLSE